MATIRSPLRASFSVLWKGVVLLASLTSPGAGQQVTVSRQDLQRRFPGLTTRAIPMVTRAGVDTVASQGSRITLDRKHFLAIQTGSVAEAIGGAVSAPVEAAPEIRHAAPVEATASHQPVAPVEATANQQPVGEVAPAPDAKRYALPYRYLMADGAGQGVWELRPVLQTAGPLRFDPVEREFRGSFYLAMEDTAHRSESRPLPVPVHLRVLAASDTLAPDELVFQSTNFPLKQVRLASGRAQDSVMIRIIPEFDLSGTAVWLPVEPALVIETPPRALQGLGIESAPVTVSIRGGRLTRPVTVSFDTDKGSFEPAVVTLDPDRPLAEVRVRSAGIGPASIRAFAPGLGEDRVAFSYTWPVPFLLAALLGGVLGGLAAALSGGDKGRAARDAVVRGLVLGLLAAVVYYAVGVSLLQVDVGVQRFNEAAVFAFAALAGLLGLRLAPGKAAGG